MTRPAHRLLRFLGAVPLMLALAATADAATFQICWRCGSDGVVIFFARTNQVGLAEPVGGLIIDGTVYDFTDVDERNAIRNATGCTQRFGPGGRRSWQVVQVTGLENGLHVLDLTSIGIERGAPGVFPVTIELLCAEADAGPDQAVPHTSCAGTEVQLDGTGSVGTGGEPVVSYEWFADDEAVGFDDPLSPTPVGVFPVGETTVMLTIEDALGRRASDTVVIEILNSNPVADAGPNQDVECSSPDGTVVTLDGSGSFDPDAIDALSFEWWVPEGSGATLDAPNSAVTTGTFQLGPTLVTLTVTDGCGGIGTADVLVTVLDETPPVVTCTTDVVSLWPPNHRMVPVWISLVAADACADPEELTISCRVSSNQPDDGTGDGETPGDVNGSDGFLAPIAIGSLQYNEATQAFETSIALRAEREGDGTRVYSIVCEVDDGHGNVAAASCCVLVPHDRRRH